MKQEDIKTNQFGNLKINPKYYALIWIALIVSGFFGNFYNIYTSISQLKNVALTIYTCLIELVAGGGLSAVLIWLLALLLYNMGAKRGLRAIPKNDFVYIIMIMMSVERFVAGIANLFCFIDPMASVYNELAVIPFVTILLSALMFFLVYVPKYLNPIQAKRYFDFYGKLFVIFNGVIYLLGAFGMLFSVEVFKNPSVTELIEEYYVTFMGTTIESAEMIEMIVESSLGITIAASISLVITVGMIVAYVVLSKMLTKKASEFNDDTPSDDMGRVFFTDGKNFYTVDDLKNNPFGVEPDKNPFDDDDKNDKVFDEFDM